MNDLELCVEVFLVLQTCKNSSNCKQKTRKKIATVRNNHVRIKKNRNFKKNFKVKVHKKM